MHEGLGTRLGQRDADQDKARHMSSVMLIKTKRGT